MNVKLKALRQLVGDYGRISVGQVFETDEETAESLEARALAERYYDAPPPPVASVPFLQSFLPRFHGHAPSFPQASASYPTSEAPPQRVPRKHK